MTERERDLSEAILGIGAVVAVVLDSLDEKLQLDVRGRIREALERWADENPEVRPPVQKLVRRVVVDSFLRP